jgi:SAM-dependent methyltransferase
MSPLARDFTPDPRRAGWSRYSLSRGELRAETESLEELERLGLLDLDRWRREELGGVAVNRKPDRWVRCIPGGRKALFAKYRRGVRRGEWLEELLHVRKPLSAAGREERASAILSNLGLATAHIVLAGEVCGALGVERESFLVTEELVGFDPAQELAWDRLAPGLRALLAGLAQRRVAVPDLYAKHLFHRPPNGRGAEWALVDLPRVEPRSMRTPFERFARHAAGLVATLPGASARELALAFPGGPSPELVRKIEDRAEVVRARKGGGPKPYAARERYGSADAVAGYAARSAPRDRAERKLIAAVLPERIDGAVLDAPCGTGRLTSLLEERGARVVSLDLSTAMALAARAESQRAVLGELERLPLRAGSVEGAVCFRFLHHLPTAEQRVRILTELARVARRFVVVSFFHPISAHHLARTAARLVRGARVDRYTLTCAELEREAALAGLRIDATRAQQRFARELWVARLVPSRS